MLTDIVAAPIIFLYPFSNLPVRVGNLAPLISTDNLILQYLTTPIFLVTELLFLITALYILFTKLRSNKQIFKYSSLTLAILSIIAFAGTTFFLLVL